MRTTSVPMGPKAFFTTVDPDLGFIADDLAVITPVALALGDRVASFETLATASLASCRTGQVSGQLDAAGQVSWAYEHGTLRVHAASGFLTTGTGDGGFDLRVRADGSFTLRFDDANEGHGAGSDAEFRYRAGDAVTVPTPREGNSVVAASADGRVVFNASAGDITFNGKGTAANPVVGWDTIQGGVGTFMIGGSAPRTADDVLPLGNCALYSASPGSVLVDMQHAVGFGGSAEGDGFVDINQLRGSAFSNVLIGRADGTDLKSGGDNSLLISLGGTGFELRPDGRGNVLVSTAGADRVLFDPGHGWALGDDNIMLGFDPNAGGGDKLDFRLLGATFDATAGADITDFVQIVDGSDGSHVLFDPTGNVATAGVEVLSLELVHGLDVQALYDNHNILI